MRLSGRSTARRLTPGAPVQNPSHPGRVLLRFEENPGFDVGESRVGRRSTALGAKRESSQDTFAPGAGAPTVREEPGFGVGESRFRCRSTALGAKRESSQDTFAPGAGAPTVREESRF